MTPRDQVIDLHTHSTVSDGTESPSDLVESAAAGGLDVVAITDHDTTGGWVEAAEAAERVGITLVRGIEISCHYHGASVHLLGYLTDVEDPALNAELARARESRATRLERMVERMAQDGIPIGYDEVLAQVAPGATAGRPHIADALVEAGLVPDRDAAFVEWLGDQSPYYVRHYAIDPVVAVQLVRAAGGVPVVAHPFTRTRGLTIPDAFVAELAEAGLAGLEAYHRDHGPEEVARAERLAAQHGLLLTGSSDYHGTGKRNRLGENTTAPEVFAEIVAQSSGITPLVGK